ncbi:MAG: hypothetical protein ACU83N_10980 [Gammaproteobacteria bacterium]
MKTLNFGFMLILMVFVYAAISCSGFDNSEQSISGSGQADVEILQLARRTLQAFNTQDGKKLAALVHPQKGVRFSPSAYIDVANDVVFSRIQVETFWTDEKSYTWGFEEGTGEPIDMTPSQYFRAYIMDRDFLNPSSISVNSDRAAGTTSNNAASVYPEATRVEYFIESSVRDVEPALDWTALRLVFERSGGDWYLVGVIHDEWTP